MSYDKKLRERALEYWTAGHTKAETAAVFKVGTSTLQTWKSQLNETGSIRTFRPIVQLNHLTFIHDYDKMNA